MIPGWGVRSLGLPYFGFVQQNLSGMLGIAWPQGSEHSIEATIAFHSAPQMFSSVDEEHALVSYFQYPALDGDLFTLGVTPSGRIYARGAGGNKLQTQAGLLTWDNAPHVMRVDWLRGTSATISLDGVPQVTAAVDSTELHPPADKFGRFALFTGVTALTRVACTIFDARYGDEGEGALWLMEEGAGPTLAPDSPNSDYPDTLWDLTATYWNPGLQTLVWGSNPTIPANHGFQWLYRNNWQRVARQRNNWARA